jgi:hypothetical protein
MRKKANVPITILVLGIFAVCAIALLSFVIAKISVRESFVGVNLIEKMSSQVEDYSVHGDINRVDTRMNDRGERVFYQEHKKSSGFLWWKKERVVFSVEYKVPT